NCAVDGADYGGTYGITTSGNALTLKFVTTNTNGKNLFKLKNQEFTFDVDVSNLPCGLNGALYFSEMDADGGRRQCPKDIKFINGEANSAGWTGSPNNPSSGPGSYGTCCNEVDIWEANSDAAAYTPHPCNVVGQTRCSGDQCTQYCDQPGCDFNSFRMGDKSFYGKGLTIDTSQKFTVVAQFTTSDGTTSGALTEIRRRYVQNGKVIQNSKTAVSGMSDYGSITDQFCTDQKIAFNDKNVFSTMGGLATMDKSFTKGVVFVLSVWDDHAANMLWLDSNYPTDSDLATPGIARGTCATTSGVPKDVESQSPDASVTYSNIRFGDIDSTYTGNGTGNSPTGTTTTSAPGGSPTSPGGAAAHYAQCGGTGYNDPTTCESPWKCTAVSPPWYYQCL
ncbi:hypothetical protein FRC06_006757, partial [Ceratobasidium sp. 370]